MGYNLIAETDKPIKWDEIHSRIMPQKLIECIPMPYMGYNGGDALGISIPSKNASIKAYNELEILIKILITEYKFSIYDLYSGEKVDNTNLSIIKANLV